jgi:hypothetical protein
MWAKKSITAQPNKVKRTYLYKIVLEYLTNERERAQGGYNFFLEFLILTPPKIISICGARLTVY